MPFSDKQRRAIADLDMGNFITANFLNQSPMLLKHQRLTGWKLTTPLGIQELTEAEVHLIQGALRNAHYTKNSGPQVQPKRADRLL